MRRLAFSCLVLLLAVGGFLYQVRLAEALPSARAAMPLAAGLLLFIAISTVFAHGRLRVLMAKPWLHYAIAVALLAALMVFGRRYRGGLYLPGRINPSEFVKLFFVMFAAGHLANGRNADGRLSPLNSSPSMNPRTLYQANKDFWKGRSCSLSPAYSSRI